MSRGHPVGRVVEWAFERVGRVRHLSDGSLFRFAVHRHGGEAVTLQDGTAVAPDDLVLELHLDNDRVRELADAAGSPRRAAAALLHTARASMEAVAALGSAGDFPPVVALFANTPRRFADITARLGFETRELTPTLRARVIARLQRGVLRRYDPAGLERIGADSAELLPVELWMSRRALLERYTSTEDSDLHFQSETPI